MTEPISDTPQRKNHRDRRIDIAGDTLMPRFVFAEELGISDKSAQKLDLPTTYLSNVAFVPKNACLKIVADTLKRRNEPPQRARRARR
jgi:hypothetical protein